jgi:hypothetical protein
MLAGRLGKSSKNNHAQARWALLVLASEAAQGTSASRRNSMPELTACEIFVVACRRAAAGPRRYCMASTARARGTARKAWTGAATHRAILPLPQLRNHLRFIVERQP